MSTTMKAKRQRRTKAALLEIDNAIVAILEAEHPMTLRQVFYRMVSVGMVEKTEAGYDLVGRQLLKLRRAGRVPYAWVTDLTRWARRPLTYDSVGDALAATARLYRRSLWSYQDVYLEVWAEKDTLLGVLTQETDPYDVPLLPAHGFSSETFLCEAGQYINAIKKPTYIYYFGDHDPSGVHIDRDIQRKLTRFAPGSEIHFERVTVLSEQIQQWNLPTRPTKQSDSRSKTFKGNSVEVEAVPPAQLRALVRQRIEQHVDQHALAVLRVAEDNERIYLREIADRFGRERNGFV